MKDPRHFKAIWFGITVVVTMIFLAFGAVGYLAFGNAVKPVITGELPLTPLCTSVKVGLSIAMLFTDPVMAFPVFEVLEEHWLAKFLRVGPGGVSWAEFRRRLLRFLFVVLTCVAAVCIPNFGYFISLVGAVSCNSLAFILPSAFHLQLFWNELTPRVRCKDFTILVFGLLAMMLCTVVTLLAILQDAGHVET